MNRLVRVARTVCRGSAITAVARPATMAFRPAQVSVFQASRSFSEATAGDEPFLDTKMVAERIIEVVKNFEKVDNNKVGPNAHFKNDLDLDSLDAVEVVMAIEEEFNIEIPDSEADKILSIADAVAYISTHPMAK